MFRIKRFEIRASEIADYLNKTFVGDDFTLRDPFSIRTLGSSQQVSVDAMNCDKQTLILTSRILPSHHCGGFIITETPELDLAYVLREFFATSPANEIHPTAIVSGEARIGRNVMIGAHSVIGPDVEIGDNTKILSGVVINGLVSIGKFCVIKDGAVIGSEGWGFINDEDGIPMHTPQLGLIRIEDRVWIGSNSTIERGMVEETIIQVDVKIDDLVHIGAGTYIGEKSELTAGVVVASHVTIGKSVHVAPNAVIREELTIHDGVFIGMGAVVIGDLSTGCRYAGNPARLIRQKDVK